LEKIEVKRIIISRVDAIGDVVLTLPLAGILKEKYPDATIIFFGKTYTNPVIDACRFIDEFINYNDFEKLDSSGKKKFLKDTNADTIIHVFPKSSIASAAKAAGIKIRIGTTNRLFHWWTCNKLVKLSRRKSDLHEAQLNATLLSPLGIHSDFTLKQLAIYIGLKNIKPLPDKFKTYLSNDKFNLILHPKSHVSAREWSLQHFHQLVNLLPSSRFNIIITGSEKEKHALSDWLKTLPDHVRNCVGEMTLDELISFINYCDGLVAASTGPLHLAAALGRYAFGIYPPIRPMYPGRWAPLGNTAHYFVMDKTCSDCRNNPNQCHCMNEITAEEVAKKIVQLSSVQNRNITN
jgi:heptosyltransferase-3